MQLFRSGLNVTKHNLGKLIINNIINKFNLKTLETNNTKYILKIKV